MHFYVIRKLWVVWYHPLYLREKTGLRSKGESAWSSGQGPGRPGPALTSPPGCLWTRTPAFPALHFPDVTPSSLAFYDHALLLQNTLLMRMLFLLPGMAFAVLSGKFPITFYN